MIRILDKFVADKIAAGEVIERPLSVVKELVENSIDAGATSIVCEIKNGGKSYIRVTDNGAGISPSDVLVAFERHATSKIETDTDLERIETLGFRGEALASIAAVSRTELITKQATDKLGSKVVISGGVVVEHTETGCPDGTTLIVNDLFFNTPARLKFMKSDKAESSVIIDFISKMALAYPGIRFRMINNDNILFSTNGKGDLKANILTIYGKDIENGLVPVDYREDYARVYGYVSSPSVSRTSRKYQIFFVNGRNINSRVIEEGVSRAYSERLFEGRFPSAFLFIETDPSRLDVNVHPNKKEVKFDDNSFIIEIVRKGITIALSTKEAVPEVKQKSIFKMKEPENTAKTAVKSEVTTSEFTKTETNPFKDVKIKDSETQLNIKKLLSTLREEDNKTEETNQERIVTVEESAPEKYISEPVKINRPFEFSDLHYCGSIFNTYILLTDESSLYMVDQHAAHERVFYERLMKSWKNEEKLQQPVMIPIIINISYSIKETLSENMKPLHDMGFDIEEFGPKSYIVKAVPMFMQLAEAEDFLNYYVDNVAESSSVINHNQLEKIAMRACKSAVKGGDVLNREEVDELINLLSKCDNPYSCPHGRPTFIKMSKYEIEKMFKRV